MKKIAIVGFGGMGSWHARSIMEKVPEIEVYGAYDIREEALENARKMGLKAYESLDALLADETVELVTVAVPNNFHKSIAIAALRAGKNVVCEKPVTLNAAELEEIMALSDRIIVMCEGRITGEMMASEANESSLGLLMMSGKNAGKEGGDK